MDDLAEWYGKIYLRGDTWHRDYTFPGQARTRGTYIRATGRRPLAKSARNGQSLRRGGGRRSYEPKA
jgi:hypothetical protein